MVYRAENGKQSQVASTICSSVADPEWRSLVETKRQTSRRISCRRETWWIVDAADLKQMWLCLLTLTIEHAADPKRVKVDVRLKQPCCNQRWRSATEEWWRCDGFCSCCGILSNRAESTRTVDVAVLTWSLTGHRRFWYCTSKVLLENLMYYSIYNI